MESHWTCIAMCTFSRGDFKTIIGQQVSQTCILSFILSKSAEIRNLAYKLDLPIENQSLSNNFPKSLLKNFTFQISSHGPACTFPYQTLHLKEAIWGSTLGTICTTGEARLARTTLVLIYVGGRFSSRCGVLHRRSLAPRGARRGLLNQLSFSGYHKQTSTNHTRRLECSISGWVSTRNKGNNEFKQL